MGKEARGSFFLVVLLIFGLFSGLFPAVGVGAAADKSNLLDIQKLIVSQEVDDTNQVVAPGSSLNTDKEFKVELNFSFFVADDEHPLRTEDQQVNEGDFASIYLGSNFKPAKSVTDSVPIYLIKTGQYIGAISLHYDESKKETTAMVEFKSDPDDPKGQFNYEPVGEESEVSVYFAAQFEAAETKNTKPGPEDDFITILDQEFPLPTEAYAEQVNFKKTGSQNSGDSNTITWTVNVSRTHQDEALDLAGYTFMDDLSTVGEYIPGTFTVDNVLVDDAIVYAADSKTLTYTYPENSVVKSVIKFQTKIVWEGAEVEKTISNSAGLTKPDGEKKPSDTEVPVNRKPGISKSFEDIELLASGKSSVTWTIELGRKGQNYGPAWMEDILYANSKFEDTPRPESVEFIFEHQNSDGSWRTLEDSEVVDASARADKPNKPNLGADSSCPEISAFYESGKVYNLGTNLTLPNRTHRADSSGNYNELQNDTFFFPELEGVYKVTVKQIFAENITVAPELFMNDAELRICGSVFSPVKPPIATGAVSIKKNAQKTQDSMIRQGIMPWNVEVNFSGAFPSEPQYVYEFFYYYDQEHYGATQAELRVEGDLPGGTFAALKDENYVNFDQAYVQDSFEAKAEDTLTTKLFPVMHGTEQVGEILQIAGMQPDKTYGFSLKTQRQDFVKLGEKTGRIYTDNTKNTVVLITGKDKTLQTYPASDYYKITAYLLRKTALAYDVDFSDTSDLNQSVDDTQSNIWSGTQSVDKNKIFNHLDNSVYFRIDVNPLGIDLQRYKDSVHTNYYDQEDYANLVVKEVLPESWDLSPMDDSGALFYIYEAHPAHIYYMDYSITFPNSANFTTGAINASAGKRLEGDELANVVRFNPEHKTWTFNNYQQKPYMIFIKLKLSDSAFQELLEQKKQKDQATSYVNTVGFKDGANLDFVNEETIKVNPKMLTKDAPTWTVGNTPAQTNAGWTINYKPYRQKKYQDVVLTDILDKNLGIILNADGEMDLSQVEITRSNVLLKDGNYDFENAEEVKVSSNLAADTVGVKYDAAEHTIIFKLPNAAEGMEPYSYRIKYPTKLIPVDLSATSIKNTVKMSANDISLGAEGEAEEELGKNVAWANLKSSKFYVVKKHAAGNSEKVLAGASFALKKDGMLVDTMVSNAKGLFYLIGLEDGNYELEEIISPETYTKLNSTIKFSVVDSQLKIDPDNTLEISGSGSMIDPILIPNETAPEETTPSKTTPSETTPGESTPGKTTPGETSPYSSTTQTTSVVEQTGTSSRTPRTGESPSSGIGLLLMSIGLVLITVIRNSLKH